MFVGVRPGFIIKPAPLLTPTGGFNTRAHLDNKLHVLKAHVYIDHLGVQYVVSGMHMLLELQFNEVAGGGDLARG